MTPAGSRGALLLIDFQYNFLADDGRLRVARNHVEPVLAAVRRAVDSAKDRGNLIVRVGNEFKPHDVIGNLLRRHAAIAGSTGARWDPRFDVNGSTYVSKWKSDAFCNPALQEVLSDHEVGRLAVAGLFARACITSTVKSAKDRGFEVLLLEDAIACKSDASRRVAISRLEQIDISTGKAGVEVD
jgi:nicotinamidase-related amidase